MTHRRVSLLSYTPRFCSTCGLEFHDIVAEQYKKGTPVYCARCWAGYGFVWELGRMPVKDLVDRQLQWQEEHKEKDTPGLLSVCTWQAVTTTVPGAEVVLCTVYAITEEAALALAKEKLGKYPHLLNQWVKHGKQIKKEGD